jgi:hypothetical protein
MSQRCYRTFSNIVQLDLLFSPKKDPYKAWCALAVNCKVIILIIQLPLKFALLPTPPRTS